MEKEEEIYETVELCKGYKQRVRVLNGQRASKLHKLGVLLGIIGSFFFFFLTGSNQDPLEGYGIIGFALILLAVSILTLAEKLESRKRTKDQ